MNEITTISRFKILKDRRAILKNPLPFHHRNFEKYGDTFRINLSKGNRWVFTRSPECIKYILQKNHKNYHKSDLQTKDLAKYVGRGLLTSNGEFWRTHRRMVQPAFHRKKLEGLMAIMHQAIEYELKEIKPNIEQDIFPLMGDLAFQVVAQSLFTADDIRSRMRKLKEITIRNQEMLIKEMRLPYFKWWFKINGEIKKHLNLSKEAKEILNDIVQKRVDSGEEKTDLLDMLLSARYEDGNPMPRKQLIDEVFILFTAGHETTANALSFTLLFLAGHQEIQQKVFQEVDKVDFESDNLIEEMSALPFTKQCVEEAMRLYPPAYFMDRVSLANDTVSGQEFKKGTVWVMSLYELHRHPDFWERPNEFRPERFDLKNKKDFSDYYFPFGAGPRMCVGNNFAMYEMIMTVAILVKRFRLSVKTDEIVINPLITLRPKEALITFGER